MQFVRWVPTAFRVAFRVAFWGAFAVVSACGEETTPTPDGAAASDADATLEVAPLDSAGEVSTTTGADAAAEVKNCGALPACLNAAGQEDFGLCKLPSADFQCLGGCCVKIDKCTTDASCAAKLGTDACPDKRFTCGCSQETNQCTQTMCLTDAECGAGKACNGGGCIAPLASGDLQARLLRPYWIALPQQSAVAAITLGAQALDKDGNVKPDAEFEWTLAGAVDAFKLDAGKLTATDKAGQATVTAKVKGSTKPASNVAKLWNLGAVAKGELRVVAVDEATLEPLAGKAVAVGLADQTTPAAAVSADLKGGVAVVAMPAGPVDIHVFSADHQPVSILRHDPAVQDVVLPLPLLSHVDAQMDDKGAIVADKSKIANADLIVGDVDYAGTGEAKLGLTALAFGAGILNFNVDAILGPKLKRPFHKDAPGFINPAPGKPQDIPGGVTFYLGPPVVTTYVMAGPPGAHVMWSLAGRIELSAITSQIGKVVSAVTDGGNIGSIVSVLLPYLQGFSSYVEFDVAFDTKPSAPLKTKAKVTPKFPLLHRVAVEMADLPKTGDASWADLAFVIGGALLPSGEIVPLGLTAGSDSSESGDKPDGKIDGNPDTKGKLEPLALAVGPLHSGVRVGAANHVIVQAAVILGGKGKKEGGSIVIGAPGVLPATLSPAAFLAFPLGAQYDPATVTLQLKPVAGAQFYRATLMGPDGQQWLVVMPGTLADKAVKLPNLVALGGPWDLAAAPKRVMLGTFELHAAATWAELVGPTGLADLVRRTKRTSFLDVAP